MCDLAAGAAALSRFPDGATLARGGWPAPGPRSSLLSTVTLGEKFRPLCSPHAFPQCFVRIAVLEVGCEGREHRVHVVSVALSRGRRVRGSELVATWPAEKDGCALSPQSWRFPRENARTCIITRQGKILQI